MDVTKLRAPAGTRYFRHSVELPAGQRIKSASCTITADDAFTMYVNGNTAGKGRRWNQLYSLNIRKHLIAGRNIIAVEATNSGNGPAGLICEIKVAFDKAKPLVIRTDKNWLAESKLVDKWETASFDDSKWKKTIDIGKFGRTPWGTVGTSPQGGSPTATAFTIDRENLVESDWLFQANGNTAPKISMQEIAWARELAARLATNPKAPSFKTELAELADIEKKLAKFDIEIDDDETKAMYLAVRRVKRQIMFKNPVLDFDKLLLADTPPYAGAHESAHRNGYNYGNRTGSKLVILDGIHPDAKTTDLLPADIGYVMRMDLSYDAKTILYGMKPTEGRSFNLYEVDVESKKIRQITNSDYDDMDPIYLPDGKILFSTSRGNTYVRCLPQSASTVLARCDADGKNIYIISRNSEPDYTPSLLPDGRVLYTRWEYTERPLWRLQKLWTINPDGTGESVYWGNGSAYPDMLWEARAIPGTPRVMFAAVGHHNVMTGCLGVLDTREGLDWPRGISKVTAELRWPEVGDDRSGKNPITSPKYHKSGAFWSFRCPYPLGPEDFLVSAARSSNGRFDLFLMDIHGNREVIYAGTRNTWYARPFRPRAKPSTIPDRVAWPKPGEKAQDGVLFSPNVYEGVEGLPPGKARYLRVIQMDAKTYSMGFKSWRHSGPVISVIQEDGVKRILGTVPIQPDGSVSFKVPSGQALHFQLLDENYRCLQIMRSFTGVMPGETRGCLGCHGMQNASPAARPDPSAAMALRKRPAELTPPPWGADVSVSYERFCQPILDKYCGECHQGDKNPKARKKLDLTLREGQSEKGITDPRLLPFKEPYLTLVGQAWNNNVPKDRPGAGFAGCLNVEHNRQYGPLKPMTMLSSTSPLIARAMSGKHNKVKIEGNDLRRLIAWVDCNCVYRGDKEVREIPDPDPKRASRFPVPVKTRTAPRIQRLQPVTDPVQQPEAHSWTKVSKEQLAEAEKLGIPVTFENKTGVKFVLAPSGEFMMGSADEEEGRYEVEGPQHKVTIKTPFYTSIHQVTQGQWESVMGTRPWDGKVHAKNNPANAVNHINWDDATEFCAKLKKKDGRTYRLPSEAEWEYACRAGTTTRYCYGDDLKLEKLADYSWHIDITWNNPDERYVHAVGRKKPNAWGVYDMHGNVWEMCLDAQHGNYKGAPSDGSAWIKDGEMADDGTMGHPLRGGGLRSTDRRVRTASRHFYRQTASSYYVGFRVICELPLKTKTKKSVEKKRMVRNATTAFREKG
jgi:formylglycine-generating enzyme required for sulfatase activity